MGGVNSRLEAGEAAREIGVIQVDRPQIVHALQMSQRLSGGAGIVAGEGDEPKSETIGRELESAPRLRRALELKGVPEKFVGELVGEDEG